MALEYIKENKGKLSKKDLKVVTPINSSSLIEDVLNPLGCEIIRTEVGDIKVAIALKEQGGFLGGETSGTYIWPDFHYGPDSIVTIAKVIQLIVRNGKGLKEMLKSIPNYPYYKDQFRLKKDIPFSEDLKKKIAATMRLSINELGKKINNVNMMDGCRFDYEGGWILIRRSGTSPYLRISGESNYNLELSMQMNKLAEENMKELDLI